MNDVLDLAPRLHARRALDCKHETVTVELEIASLTCDTCGAEIDPWWFIRRTATETRDERQRTDAWIAQREADYASWAEDANQRIREKEAQIAALFETKHQLANELINGVRVGSAVRGRRKS